MLTSVDIINWLKLQPNNFEGGYFVGTYEGRLKLADSNLPNYPATDDARSLSSAIYYFLDKDGCSILHKVTGDMIYHFYFGDPVQMLLLYPKEHPNQSEVFNFSNNIEAGGSPMKLIPGGTWLGSRLMPGGSFALMGVTMAPGFHPNDYKLGDRQNLIAAYPDQEFLISELTR